MSNNLKRVLGAVAVVCTAGLIANPATADSHPSITALNWMTGSWAGPAGPGRTLEENWIIPTGGSLASLVRITTEDATPMVELIVIEEENDTLILRIQQWDPGFSPRTSGPQVMTLSDLGERSVKFVATGETGMRSLAYSSPDPESFNIDIVGADGNAFQLQLARQPTAR
jgi:hypothetical protein